MGAERGHVHALALELRGQRITRQVVLRGDVVDPAIDLFGRDGHVVLGGLLFLQPLVDQIVQRLRLRALHEFWRLLQAG